MSSFQSIYTDPSPLDEFYRKDDLPAQQTYNHRSRDSAEDHPSYRYLSAAHWSSQVKFASRQARPASERERVKNCNRSSRRMKQKVTTHNEQQLNAYIQESIPQRLAI